MSRKYRYKNPHAVYFSTCTVMGWIDIFTRDVYRRVIIDSLEYCRVNKGLEVMGYVIMSNHIHLLIQSTGDNNISSVMRDFKRHTSRQIMMIVESDGNYGYESRKNWMMKLFSFYGTRKSNTPKNHFWEEGDRPKEILNDEMFHRKLSYIHLNPVKNGLVSQPEHYLYSSASYYSGLVDDILEIRQV